VTTGPTPNRVEFWVDGKLRWTEQQAPYVFNGDGSTWDTTKESDGAHELVTKAYAGGARLQATITVTVRNAAPASQPPPSPAATAVSVLSQTLTDGQTLSGTVTWQATLAGDVRRVELWIDGARAASFRRAPYGGSLDTTRLRNGPHTFAVHVTGTDGSTATASVAATVANR
jgi:hypothetical protein